MLGIYDVTGSCCQIVTSLSCCQVVTSLGGVARYVTECAGGGVSEETGIPGVSRASLLSGHAGLWKTCKTVLSNETRTPGQAYVISEWSVWGNDVLKWSMWRNTLV